MHEGSDASIRRACCRTIAHLSIVDMLEVPDAIDIVILATARTPCVARVSVDATVAAAIASACRCARRAPRRVPLTPDAC